VRRIGDAFEITLTVQSLGLFVTVESDIAGRMSDNAVTLLPGQTTMITFTSKTPGQTPNFTLRDLHSATYGS
jgi:beta-mannosidase